MLFLTWENHILHFNNLLTRAGGIRGLKTALLDPSTARL